MQEYQLESIGYVVQDLLKEGLFSDEARARKEFPEIFKTTQARQQARNISEIKAAKCEAKAIEESVALSDKDEEVQKMIKDRAEISAKTTKETNASPKKGTLKGIEQTEQQGILPRGMLVTRLGPAMLAIPHLQPVYLPYSSQHNLLKIIQALLEECCFDFGKKWLPEILAAKGWECPESVELNIWAYTLLKKTGTIPPTAFNSVAEKDFAQVLSAIPKIRHTAVHRLQTTAAGILSMVETAIALANMLKDEARASELDRIRKGLAESIEEILQNQILLESKLSDELQSIAKRRAELDELENLAVKGAVDNDLENRKSVGSALTSLIDQLQKPSKKEVNGYNDGDLIQESEEESADNLGLEELAEQSKTHSTAEEFESLLEQDVDHEHGSSPEIGAATFELAPLYSKIP
ncbi:hypothetical protein MMC06_002951 [Schaereria dolodes]|nr:hypothetical protein [Schaereria dolodes]